MGVKLRGAVWPRADVEAWAARWARPGRPAAPPSDYASGR
jgi:hypothetical protein